MWPTLDRYNQAVNTPTSCFADLDLRMSMPMRDRRRGLPVPSSGAFGCVYRMEAGARTWAVKCFTHEVPSSEYRYTEVSSYIKAHPAPCLVACEYLWRGIMVDGRPYPVLKMDWVEGLTLDRFLEQNRDQAPLLETLAERWLQAMRALDERGIAHGDLQHGNVLIAGGPGGLTLKLVDYDGMYIPAFQGEEGDEAGLRAYQHPQRTGHHFNERVDHFAALVIYISLRALARQPDLWDRYHKDDNLIFQPGDFWTPDQSPLFADLSRLPDPGLVALLDTLRGACADADPGALAALPALVAARPGAPPALPPPADPVTPAPVEEVPPPAGAQVAPVEPVAPPAPPRAAPAPVPPPELPPARPAVDLPARCPRCGEDNRAVARFCRGCGLPFPYTGVVPAIPAWPGGAAPLLVCAWCYAQNPSDERWCRSCGRVLT